MYSSCIYIAFFTLTLIYNVGSHNVVSMTTTRQIPSPHWGASGGSVWWSAPAARTARCCSCSSWDLLTKVLWGTSHPQKIFHESVQVILKEHLQRTKTVLQFFIKFTSVLIVSCIQNNFTTRQRKWIFEIYTYKIWCYFEIILWSVTDKYYIMFFILLSISEENGEKGKRSE